MLLSSLWTAKQQRIVAALLLQPDKDFSMTELIEQAGGGSSSTYDFVTALARDGIVHEQRVRNTRLFQANRGHPVFDELHAIVVKTFGVAEPIAAALRPLAERHRIDAAFIFGSYAKGTDQFSSDIDLFVVGNVSVGKLRVALDPVQQQLGREIHPNVYGIEGWPELLQTDPVIKSIWEGPRIELHLAPPSQQPHEEPAADRRPARKRVRMAPGTAVQKKQ